jgi:hypothetical protein
MNKYVVALSVLATLVATTSCGQDSRRSTSEVIATVDKTEIPRAELDRKVAVVLRRGQGQSPAARRHLRGIATGTIARSLIEGEWIEQEAASRGIDVKDRPRRSQRRLAALQERLLERMGPTKPSEREIRAYFAAYRSSYAQPERRSVQLVTLDSRPAAARIKGALSRGVDWRAVAKRFPHRYGGLVSPARTDLPRFLATAVFSARIGDVSGPLQTKSGWVVFEVTGTLPAVEPELGRAARASIIPILRDRQANVARERWYSELKAKYQPLTKCSDDIRLPSCHP